MNRMNCRLFKEPCQKPLRALKPIARALTFSKEKTWAAKSTDKIKRLCDPNNVPVLKL